MGKPPGHKNFLSMLSLKDKILLSITTLLGVGYTPFMPGTASCVVAVLIFLILKVKIYYFIFTIISVFLAFLLSGQAEKILKEKDSKKIVIDDFSGMLVTFLFIPQSVGPAFIISGFFLFRMLDMLKIPPADRIENFDGSRGIVGDDIVAGIYANLILQAVRLLLKIFS